MIGWGVCCWGWVFWAEEEAIGYFFGSTLLLIEPGWVFYVITDDEWALSNPETYDITFPIKLVLLS